MSFPVELWNRCVSQISEMWRLSRRTARILSTNQMVWWMNPQTQPAIPTVTDVIAVECSKQLNRDKLSQ